ncbi:MAG: hypothetical protein LBR08_09890 [Bacteroidales bacterium]|jgi:hypothetical protein|nr:hypothetical protein [Bacteroidales bacterium]
MKSRRKFTAKFKDHVAIAAIREQSSLNELSEKYQLQSDFQVEARVSGKIGACF